MPKDYKNAPRSGARGRRNKPRKQGPVVPGWIWLGGILVLGIAIGLAGPRLFGLATGPAVRPAPKAGGPVAKPPAKAAAPAEQSAPRFDFYKMLPKFQVVIPKEDKDVQTDTGTAPVAQPGAYVLQVASFQQYGDADAMKAKLALLGVVAQIQQVRIAAGQTWNRVRIGPISDLARLNKVRQTLREHHIEPLLIKVGNG